MIKMNSMKHYLRMEWILLGLAILGLAGGIYMVIVDQRVPPIQTPVTDPSAPPYAQYIAASGIIEPEGGMYYISPFDSGVVEKIMVNQGDRVKKGDPLFVLDTRQAQADLAIKKAELAAAEAGLAQAQLAFQNKKTLYDMVKNLKKGEVSREERVTRRDQMGISLADRNKAQADRDTAQAARGWAQTALDRLTVVAPMDGKILQVNIGEGEFVDAESSSRNPSILFGKMGTYQVRVDIDENDAWRFKPGAPAAAYMRGQANAKIPLTYSYYEPYVVPKAQLTGMSTEKVDVRVLQVIYTYDPTVVTSYIGQQVDVYIEARS